MVTATAHARPAAVLRVLMVTTSFPTVDQPARGTFIKSQVDSLAKVGVDATVLHLQGHSPSKHLRGMVQVIRCCDPSRFDLVHGHYGINGVVARAQWRTPVVVSYCGDDLLGTPDARGRKTLASRLIVLSSLMLAHVVDGIIVKSEEMGRLIRPRPRATVSIIPNGVDFDLFRPESKPSARAHLGLDDDPAHRYVLFPADPSIPRKAFWVAQGAVDRLRASGVEVDLLPVYNRPQAELTHYYNASDVVVLPSLWEGSPNVVKEAMACSVPVVATDVGDVRQVIAKTPGCTVAERTPEAFAEGLHTGLSVPDGRTLGREHVAHLSVESVAGRVRAVYEEAIASWQRGGRR